MSDRTAFTPALGRPHLTAHYDRVVALMTRERTWRAKLLAALAPAPGDTIVDLGSGTATQALMVKAAEPLSRVIAVDPDPDVIALAEAKIAAARLAVETLVGFGDPETLSAGIANKVVSSLVLHQCDRDAKQGLLRNACRLLKPGGLLLIADYGLQRSALMALLFRQVRLLDGFANTKANKDGEIPAFIERAGFAGVAEIDATSTPTGSIALFRAVKA